MYLLNIFIFVKLFVILLILNLYKFYLHKFVSYKFFSVNLFNNLLLEFINSFLSSFPQNFFMIKFKAIERLSKISLDDDHFKY